MTDFNAAPDTSAAKETTATTFRADVLTASAKQPVLVEFWSPRDASGAKFSPLLQKVASKAAGKLTLVRMNVDETPQIASQLGLQSVPAVIAFQKGQPVDGFTGALPEAQIKGFIERIAGPLDTDIAEMLAEAESLAASADIAGAVEIYQHVLAQEPGHPRAAGGMARLLVNEGDTQSAQALLESLPESASREPAVAAAKAALDLAMQASNVGDLAPLRARIEADPADYQARLDLALALGAVDKREEAADLLLEIIRKDRKCNAEAARKQLLQFFEAWGPMDPETISARRKLSGLLFS